MVLFFCLSMFSLFIDSGFLIHSIGVQIMEVLIHKFYKSKNGNYIVIVRDLGFFATKLVAKPRKYKLIEAVAIDIVKDFYEQEYVDEINIKFVDDPDCEQEVSIVYYETCYGWEA